MRRGVVVRALILGALLAPPTAAEAQLRGSGPGGSFGVSFVAVDPIGEMGGLVDNGFGLEIGGGLPAALDGHVRVRADFGFLVYGWERLRYCSGLSCRLASDLTTTNSIVYGGIGPELVLINGPIQPYVHATAGLSGFITSSSLNDYDGYGPYLETTNYSDVVFGWKFGGGLRMRVGGHRKPVFIDLGVERHDNGIAQFLTEGDIVDNPDGSVTIFPNRSEADMLAFRVGISVGFPSGRGRR